MKDVVVNGSWGPHRLEIPTCRAAPRQPRIRVEAARDNLVARASQAGWLAE